MRATLLHLVASTVLIGAMSAAEAAQYSVFTYHGVEYTDVVVNNIPQTLAAVQEFETRCGVDALPGQLWVDSNGNLGRVGASATYNINTCSPVSRVTPKVPDNFRVRTQVAPNGRCTFFGTGGSICRW